MADIKKMMKAEAIKRMERMEMPEDVIKDFSRDGKVRMSEANGVTFFLYENLKKVVEEWEKETGSLVYHAIHSTTQIGEFLTVMYVSSYDKEWWMYWEDLDNDVQDTYTFKFN